MKRLGCFLFFICCFFMSVCGQSISGPWSGKMDMGMMKLNIVFHIDKDDTGKAICSLDSPDQGVKGIAAELLYASSDSLSISVPSLMVTYSGSLHEGVIKGVFSQSGYSFNLDLKPGGYMSNRPQTPLSPFPYKTEEVKFSNPDDGAVLSGTLTYPSGYDNNPDGNKSVPVVLMVTGSGLQNRDEEVFSHKPFLVIADYLAKNGIASLRYDDRGFGKSSGDVMSATTFTFMRDAKAGTDYLRSLGMFGQIGVLGHSEGGTIAFMLGAGKHADFVISMAGAAVKGSKILVEQNRVALMLAGMSEETTDTYCKALERIYEYKDMHPSDRSPEALDDILKSIGGSIPSDARNNLKAVMDIDNAWMNSFISYDPEKELASCTCPVLAINGSLDTQVISGQNIAVIKSMLPANEYNVIKEYSGLNHLFQHAVTGSIMEYNNIEETISPEVLHDVAEWIKSLK